jgi:hypothetical protein
MSEPPVPPPIEEPSVRGGVDGIVAHCNEMRALAGRFGDAAHETAASTVALHGYLLEPAIALSGFLDPAGYAAFETELGIALDLPGAGLTWCGVTCAGLDVELRAAAEAYQIADKLATLTHDVVAGALLSSPALVHGLATLASTGDLGRAGAAVLETDPELVDVADLALLTSPPAVVFAATLPDGTGVARSTGLDATGVAGAPPRQFVDVVQDLGQRNDDQRHGEIDVRILTMPDGTRRAIVDLTGTKSWSFGASSDVSDLRTDARAVLGESTAYEQGVLAAMHDAGVRPGDQVMLVGHSEGGVVAVNAARDAVASGAFNVTHVVTLGAPIAGVVGGVPANVQVLAIENDKDVVVHADGFENPDEPNVTTATVSHGDGQIVDDHSIGHAYLPGAADVQASSNGSLRHFLASADGFFRADSVRTHTFQITRR